MSNRRTFTPDALFKTAAQFRLYGDIRAIEPYGTGHINDTFVVRVDQAGAPVRFILQRINHDIFRNVPALMDNVLRVTSHQQARLAREGVADRSRRALTVVSTHDGASVLHDAEGNWWRVYLFIEGARTHDLIETPAQARAAACGFGQFLGQLDDLPGAPLNETIPGFHHTPGRVQALEAAIKADPKGRAAEMREEIAFARSRAGLARLLLDRYEAGEVRMRATHNDTKLNNVMLDEATQKAVCVLDLDTLMPGLVWYDFGDMVRTGTNSAPEDVGDPSRIRSRIEIFAALAEGFIEGAGHSLNTVELGLMARAGQVLTYECGIRFLTDYLQGDVYFKIKRPSHNRDRVHNQFALLQSQEKQEADYADIVKAAAAARAAA